ncbi:MAG: class I tRNA ligase family protein, partial [Candidatus Pacebacteria bacterium]|nr:class I tRNA ligase family protein [Candidatus Paceibacterota bacterium]
LSTDLNDTDRELLREAHRKAAEVSGLIEEFRLDLAADAVYHFVWHRFADEIIEESKPILKGEDQASKDSRAAALYQILLVSLKLLHPFMPYVTESIWQELPRKDTDALMVSLWPEHNL